MSDLRTNIPEGKIRVILVDLFDHEEYLIKDFSDREEAFSFVDKRNKKRENDMSCVYYAYDDKGKYIRGNEAVNQKIQP